MVSCRTWESRRQTGTGGVGAKGERMWLCCINFVASFWAETTVVAMITLRGPVLLWTRKGPVRAGGGGGGRESHLSPFFYRLSLAL